MRFARPEMLIFLLALPLMIPFLFWTFRSRRRNLERFGHLALLHRLTPRIPWEWRLLRFGLLALGLGLFLLALAEPQWGSKMETVQRRGVDVVIALDTSLSMLAEDISPNRLERAKSEVISFLQHLRGDRVALVAFAGTGHIHCPLTSDQSAVRAFLEILAPDFLPVQGTAIGDAIRTSLDAFPDRERKYQVILLLTDGEDSDSDPIGAAREAARRGVRIHTIGIGSPAGDLIPLRDGTGTVTGYKKDEEGQVVTTRLDESTLERIARLTGGSYYRSTTGEMELERIAAEVQGMEKREFQDRRLARLEHRYQIPLSLAILILSLEFCLPANWPRRPRREAAAVGRGSAVFWAWVCILVLSTTPVEAGSAARLVREGNRLYGEGNFEEATKKYTEAQLEVPEAPEIRYNLGNVLYRQGKYPEAVEEYQRARSTRDRSLEQAAQYNIGNAYLQMNRFAEAIRAYEQTLRMDPSDPEAKRNLEIAWTRLQEENRKAQEEPPPEENPEEGEETPSEPGPRQREAEGEPPEEDQREEGPPGESEPEAGEKPETREGRMTPQEALRLLDALQEDEKDSLRKGIRFPPAKKGWGRDW